MVKTTPKGRNLVALRGLGAEAVGARAGKTATAPSGRIARLVGVVVRMQHGDGDKKAVINPRVLQRGGHLTLKG